MKSFIGDMDIETRCVCVRFNIYYYYYYYYPGLLRDRVSRSLWACL